MQHNNTKMHESTNEKILTERKQIQENGKFEKKWKNVSQFSSNFIPEFKLQVLGVVWM